MEEHLKEYKDYVLEHFNYEYSCEDPMILTQLHLAKEKVYNWLGRTSCNCNCNVYPYNCCNENVILESIFMLAYYLTVASYDEQYNYLEMAAYLKLKNAGLICF